MVVIVVDVDNVVAVYAAVVDDVDFVAWLCLLLVLFLFCYFYTKTHTRTHANTHVATTPDGAIHISHMFPNA